MYLGDPQKEHPNSWYINANYIDGPYLQKERIIATQGPKKETYHSFWRMVYLKNVSLIFMLCGTEEKGQPKCHKYWPRTDVEWELDPLLTLSQANEESLVADQTVMRTFRLSPSEEGIKQGLETREVRQIHYTGWPDHGIPDEKGIAAFDLMLDEAKSFLEEKESEKVVVHCSAGVGRTGTFIAMLHLLGTIE